MAASSPSSVVDAVSLEDLNILLSDLDLANVNFHTISGTGGGGGGGSLDTEQGGFTEQGVQPGGRQEATFSHFSSVVLGQVRDLERALLVSRGVGEGQQGTDRDIVEAAVARGMSTPSGRSDGPAAR